MAAGDWMSWRDVVRLAGGRRAQRLVREFALRGEGRRFHRGEVLRALQDLVDREVGGAGTEHERRRNGPEYG